MLEEMARALYREWFVEYRFPGHEQAEFVEDEQGRRPKEWERQLLVELASVQYGFAFKSKQFAERGSYKIARIRDVLEGDSKTFTEEACDKKYNINNGDVLVGMDGDFHIGQWIGGEARLVQRVALFKGRYGLPNLLVRLILEAPISNLNKQITGTTVAHLGDKHIKEITLLLPRTDVMTELGLRFRAIDDLVQNLRLRNANLRRTRDLLLPRLVSGELDVSELEIAGVAEDTQSLTEEVA